MRPVKTRQNIGPPVTPTASPYRCESKDPEQLNDIQLPVAIRGKLLLWGFKSIELSIGDNHRQQSWETWMWGMNIVTF